jgi:hypothetical protein
MLLRAHSAHLDTVGFLFIFLDLKPFPLPDHRKLLLISVLVFTALLFIEHFLVVSLYEDVTPDILYPISGLFLVFVTYMEFYVVFKRILKQDEDNKISVVYLTAFGCLIVLFSSIVFQTYRQTGFSEITNADRIRIFMIGAPGFAFVSGLFAFSVAIDVKIKNRWLTTLVYAVIGVMFYFLGPYMSGFVKGE